MPTLTDKDNRRINDLVIECLPIVPWFILLLPKQNRHDNHIQEAVVETVRILIEATKYLTKLSDIEVANLCINGKYSQAKEIIFSGISDPYDGLSREIVIQQALNRLYTMTGQANSRCKCQVVNWLTNQVLTGLGAPDTIGSLSAVRTTLAVPATS